MTQHRITEVYEILSQRYPVFAENNNEWSANGLDATPFRNLVSVALSTMTQSTRCIKACVALYERADTPEGILELEDDELRALIKPVAHYNRKTISIKRMCRMLLDDYDGEIPKDHSELMKLPGIGRKCADIMMNFIFDEPTVAVDTHVHRVVNRIGIVETSTHTQTADRLAAITPDGYKAHAHEWLIQHGMKTCVAQSPHCPQCPVANLCDYASH